MEKPLPKEISNLAVTHLQLENIAGLLASSYRTIHDLEMGILNLRPRSKYQRDALPGIQDVLDRLHVAITAGGIAGWDQFRDSRPRLASLSEIAFFSPSLERLNNEGRGLDLAKLHLGRRARNALHAAGISSIGRLIERAHVGIFGLNAAGELTSLEIVDSLQALSKSLTGRGAIDWIAFAQHRGFLLLPAVNRAKYSIPEFLRLLPEVCREAVMSRFGTAEVFVLEKRFIRPPDRFIKLRDIGKRLKLTGERVRQLESNVSTLLHGIIWRSDYGGCRFRVRRAFLEPLYDLASQIRKLNEGELSVARWRLLLKDVWGIEPSDLGDIELLIFNLLALDRTLFSKTPLFLSAKENTQDLRAALGKIRELFRRRRRDEFSLAEITQHLAQLLGPRAPVSSTVSQLLAAVPTIEFLSDRKCYRVRLEALYNYGDLGERILRDAGAPMHFREISAKLSATRLSKRGTIDPLRLARRMVRSERFVCISKTGIWGLREWGGVDTRRLVDIAADLLSTSQSPLTEKQIFDVISRSRIIKIKSIGSLLRLDERFTRVGAGALSKGWTLADPRATRKESRACKRKVQRSKR